MTSPGEGKKFWTSHKGGRAKILDALSRPGGGAKIFRRVAEGGQKHLDLT